MPLDDDDDLRRKLLTAQRQDRRQRRNETELLKRQRRMARLQEQGWTEDSLLKHEDKHKALAEQERNQKCSKAREIPVHSPAQHNQSTEFIPPQGKTLRIAVVGCGGWFCNRAHLPALTKIMRKSALSVCITVLCGSNHDRAIKTLRRNGISLTVGDNGNVAAFDTLESYLDYEQKLSGVKEGAAVPRQRALADVCLLLLPIPQMAHGIGACLRAGKYVISEKPVSTNSYESQSLWNSVCFLRAGHRWVVSENWAYKPSVHAACRLVQSELLRQQHKPISYQVEVVQCLDNSCWRHGGYRQYDGGATRDLGVHCIRALRLLFGEIENVEDCEFTANDECCLLRGSLHHGDYGITGGLRVELKEDLIPSEQKARVTISFPSSTQLVWDISKCTFHRHEPGKASILLQTIQGDSWVTGGVRELLTAALGWFHENEYGRNPRTSPEHGGMSCLQCTPEEAFRDAAVVDAMLADCGQSGVASAAQNELANPEAAGVQRCRPRPMISRMGRSFMNSLGTSSFRPTGVAWCASVNDVVSAITWGQDHSLGIAPIGMCHSSCLFQDNDVCVSTSLISRVFDFQVDDSRAYIRVGSGMTLNCLASLLKSTEYTMASFPILLNQSVGGAIATGSHGSSAHHGTISDSIVAVRLASLDGRVRTILPENVALTVQTMTSSDANELLHSDALMKIARCSCGSIGIITDVVFELAPAVPLRRAEVVLDLNAPAVCQTLQELAFETEHCWIQWVVGEDENSDEAAAITLSAVAIDDEQEETSELYDGRCWYPYCDTVSAIMAKERRRQPGETKHTCQWSFPLSSVGDVIDFVKASRLELSARVVEFKFLPASPLTTFAPNSVRECVPMGTPVVALNVWWELSELGLFELLESRLREVPGASPHYGKWFSDSGAPLTRSSPVETIHDNPEPKPLLSVILPVYNAMPWLPIALRDILKQDVTGEVVEVLAGDDASSDGSLAFLINVALALGKRGSIEVVEKGGRTVRELTRHEANKLQAERLQNGVARSTNPALLAPCRGADFLPSDHYSDTGPSPDDVARETGSRNRLRVLLNEDYVNVGQGAVMTRCHRVARGAYIGHMESDDARPDGAFQEMMDALRAHPEWDAVTSRTECIGRGSVGMERYVEWQNEQDTPEKMRAARFVEIPSLHQTGVFRAAAVSLSTQDRCYFDDKQWPVDLHFWLSFFHAGLTVGKVPKVLFYWRQHHGQQTRNHGRLSIANMRKCKCEFLCMDGGPIFHNRGTANEETVIEIWSTGQTLAGWVNDVSSELEEQGLHNAQVVPVNWKPGLARPPSDSSVFEGRKRRVVRLFAFGMDKVRRKVAAIFASEWNDADHIFVS